MKWIWPWLLWIFGVVAAFAAPLKVSALHPLMADLARQVGAERVDVFDLVGEGGNPHRMELRPADMQKLQSSALVLASGKNLEPYLGRVKSSLSGVTIIEVGSTIPSLTVEKNEICDDCSDHTHGTVDPHWWQSIDNMRRAGRVVALALAEKDPEGKDFYLEHASAYGRRLGELKIWVKRELGKVPVGSRKLVTAHNAFAYFTREFGFEIIAVAGLNNEQNTTPREQAQTIDAVKESGVSALFPETGTGVKAIEAIAKATGTKLAVPLISDGNGKGKDAGFEAMIRHNVQSITEALGAP